MKKALTIRELQDEAYTTAWKKGWHDKERDPLVIAALLHSEVSEFLEDCRRYDLRDIPQGTLPIKGRHMKPCGPAIELADLVIRVADFFGRMGWSLESAILIKLAFNRTRPYRHGGKRA